MGLKNGTVTLENNHLKWAKMFKEEKNFLKEIFGELAIEIEHIGSTAIKGIDAKPIIDIAIAVNDFRNVEKIKTKLETIYTFINNENAEEIILVKEDSKITYFLIHIMKVNSKRYKDAINFRDYISNNYEDLKRYECLKHKLIKLYSNDRKMYTKSKNDFIQEILRKINN